MTRMFCTVREAAETLSTDPEQIETLLQEGILHEFRDGPRRLLKTDEIGSLLAAPARSNVTGRDRPPQRCIRDPLPLRDRAQPEAAPSRIRLPRSAAAAVKPADGAVVRPQNTRGSQWPRTDATPRRPTPQHTSRRPGPVDRHRGQPHHLVAEPQDLSVRQWLWSGLVQDRPTAVALLSGLVLLALAGLVAGIYALCELL